MFKEVRAPRFTLNGRELSAAGTPYPPLRQGLGRLLEASRHVTVDPTDSSQLVRWTSDRWNKVPELPTSKLSGRLQDVLLAVKTAERHYAKLNELGISIPAHTYLAIGRDPESDDAVAVYARVEHIVTPPMGSLLRQQQEPALQQRLAEPLAGYYTWLTESREPYMLMDISDPRQYGFGEQGDAADAPVYLFDLEPNLTDTAYFTARRLAEQFTRHKTFYEH